MNREFKSGARNFSLLVMYARSIFFPTSILMRVRQFKLNLSSQNRRPEN